MRDGRPDHITREPEQVKAFRDTWRNGIHSYLSYLRDRLEVARDLLTDSGSVFVQIGDQNVHRVRVVLDEVFGEEAFVAQITFRVKSPLGVSDLARTTDFLLWYARNPNAMKFRRLRVPKDIDAHPEFSLALMGNGHIVSRAQANRFATDEHLRFLSAQNLGSSGYTPSCMFDVTIQGKTYSHPRGKSWKTNKVGMRRLQFADRLHPLKTSLRWRYFFDDAPSEVITDVWIDTFAASNKNYVVQTAASVIQRCLLMTTDPGDLVLDPTCGSGTTAYVAEQWGRRWITIDTSRVALALARARIMGARYPYYLLSDSYEGKKKEAEVARTEISDTVSYGDIRQGFVYERVPHVQLRHISNNSEIDIIWEQFQCTLEPLREQLNASLGESWQEWEVPREAKAGWPPKAQMLHQQWWKQRIARQREIDASIAAKAEVEYLYDQPYQDNRKVRVAGPFTVESLLPHRILGINEDDELIEGITESQGTYGKTQDFGSMILAHLRTAGVQQTRKEDHIAFSSVSPWPGRLICAEGRYVENGIHSNGMGAEKRAGIFIGPEFGTVSRPDLVEAAREAAETSFDVLIACAFNYEAHVTEFNKLGRIPILKARMNADLHMAGELKNTGKGNLFVIFGEPDIDILDASGDDDADPGQIRVRVNGVDVFHPNSGEVRSDGPEGIACWFIDTDYSQESFFVRHAYFLGQNNPYKALKTTLKAEINEEAWETLCSDTSRPFDKPKSGRIAVKVINHLGDEVMKVCHL